jgi:hypothetical protein
MKLTCNYLVLILILISGMGMFEVEPRAHAQQPSSQPGETEWTWEVRPPHPDPALPNVLLIGDSLTRNYYPEVKRQLNGAANVYLFSTSACVGDPRLLAQLSEFAAMESVPFRVVHFNNGMHGWTYSEDQYSAAFPAFVARIRAVAPHAALIWATTTPVRIDKTPGPTNARIDERNKIADRYVQTSRIVTDDEHGLMTHESSTYLDDVHFNQQGADIQGRKAAQSIRDLLRAAH